MVGARCQSQNIRRTVEADGPQSHRRYHRHPRRGGLGRGRKIGSGINSDNDTISKLKVNRF